MSSERYVLAVDLGSSSVKTALVSSCGDIAAGANRPIHTLRLGRGAVEQDPHQWWSATVEAAREALAAAAVDPARIAAIKCTTQWAVTTPVDAEGQTLTNALSWMDSRGGRHTRAMVHGPISLGGYDVLKLWRWIRFSGGCPVRSGVDGLGHILHLKHDRPEVYARTHKFLEPMDYLNLRLTGKFAASFGTIFPYWVTDNRDPSRIAYHPTLLRMAGIEREKLPDLLPVDAVLGELQPNAAAELGLSTETKVFAGACDGHAATVGAGAIADYEGYFYIGTTSWLSCHVPMKKTDMRHSILSMPAALPGRYMVAAEQGAAGRCLEFLKDEILFPRDGAWSSSVDGFEVLNREAEAVRPGSDGLIFTPWVNGAMVPVEDPYTRSAFINQSLGTTRGHYARAVMEGVAYNLRWLRRHVEEFIGRPFPHLNFIGGAALSPVWCQILADVIGCPIRQVANPRYANAVGAGLAAFAALGEIAESDIGHLVAIEKVYAPRPETKRLYDEMFEQFLELYKRLKPIYKKLNGEIRRHV